VSPRLHVDAEADKGRVWEAEGRIGALERALKLAKEEKEQALSEAERQRWLLQEDFDKVGGSV
jgi:hypothetical protein